jgi:hypothetical protein
MAKYGVTNAQGFAGAVGVNATTFNKFCDNIIIYTNVPRRRDGANNANFENRYNQMRAFLNDHDIPILPLTARRGRGCAPTAASTAD